MKKIPLLLVFSICFYNACAQKLKESAVPVAVKAGFTALHPMAKNVKWEIEEGNYEAGFSENSKKISVLLDAAGGLIQTETEVSVSSLPKAALDYASKNLKGNIEEAAKIVAASGTVTYEAEVGKVDYLFDAYGDFIKTGNPDPEDDEDD